MLYAFRDGTLVELAKGARADCPLCEEPVLAKCGEVVDWYWSHEAGTDCDPWSENETPWHRWWKERAPLGWREVTVGPHRADIRRDDQNVIELQHSSIAPSEIREREVFYAKMIWILDARLYSAGAGTHRLSMMGRDEWLWRWPRRSFCAAQKRVCLDLGQAVLEITSLSADGYLTGKLRSRARFLRMLRLEQPSSPDDSIVSYIAEWERESRSEHATRASRSCREFRHREALDRWIERRRPAHLTVFAWYGNGALRAISLKAQPTMGSL